MPAADSRESLTWPMLWAERAGPPLTQVVSWGRGRGFVLVLLMRPAPEASRSGQAAPCSGTRGGGGGTRPGMSTVAGEAKGEGGPIGTRTGE